MTRPRSSLSYGCARFFVFVDCHRPISSGTEGMCAMFLLSSTISYTLSSVGEMRCGSPGARPHRMQGPQHFFCAKLCEKYGARGAPSIYLVCMYLRTCDK
jgi:hypothetical protein